MCAWVFDVVSVECHVTKTPCPREAVGPLGTLQCPLVVTEKLKERAVALFGAPSSWSQAQVNTLGNIIGQSHI